jgi:hypothetical protein
MRTICLLLLGTVTGMSALVSAYHVDPKTAAMSGKVSGNPAYGGVSEVITACFDSLTDPAYIECFVGDGNPSGYKVEVLTYPGPGQVTVASKDTNAARGYTWVHFGHLNVTHPELIVKGRQLEVRFSRVSGSDSIEYWRNGDTILNSIDIGIGWAYAQAWRE